MPSWGNVIAVAAALYAGAAHAQTTDKAEITIENSRTEAVTMRFAYAFRNYHWTLMTHDIAGGEDILYRFPANIPGCEKLREWHITDGVVSISDAKGLFCEMRMSLCDKRATKMIVHPDKCLWTEP